MTVKEKFVVLTPVCLTILFLWGNYMTRPMDEYYTNDYVETIDSIPEICDPTVAIGDSLCTENLYCYLDSIGVHHVDIVVRQAILETGWYTSISATRRHNLFGLTNGKTRKLFTFDNWKEGCVGYRDMVQYKYEKMGYNYDDGDYYTFLVDMHYAADPKYVSKLRGIKYDY